MPKRLARIVKDYLYDSNYELDRRLFYLITGLGTFASIIGIVIAFITNAEVYSIIAMCLFLLYLRCLEQLPGRQVILIFVQLLVHSLLILLYFQCCF